jgi:hypothetical protein
MNAANGIAERCGTHIGLIPFRVEVVVDGPRSGMKAGSVEYARNGAQLARFPCIRGVKCARFCRLRIEKCKLCINLVTLGRTPEALPF